MALFFSGPHRSGFQSLLVLILASGGWSGAALRGSSDIDYGKIPLTFVANRGQSPASVRFMAKGPGLTAYFQPREVALVVRGSAVRMRYLGASASANIEGLEPQPGRVNFLLGNDTARWRTDVPQFGRVVYRQLYPGVDMEYAAHGRLLKSEFVVSAGADPSLIRIEYSADVRVDDDGALVLTTSEGELKEAAPEIYQECCGVRLNVSGAFRISGRVVTFEIGDYDRTQPLRIDPVLSYSTYIGGNGTERATAIAIDSTRAAYLTGYTDSSNFPVTAGAAQSLPGGGVEAFVTKLNPAGNAIVFTTYLGGNGDDRGLSIAVNSSGNVYLTGYTTSTNFPTATPFQAASGGGRDAFVAKLNATGTALLYSTYLGGSGADSGNGIAVDASGAAYITGATTSTNFPAASAFQSTLGGAQDGFVTKLNAAGNGLVFSTYLGGALDDRGSDIAVDAAGSAYVAGNTNSTNFPTASAVQSSNGGSQDAFVTKLNAAGSALLYSTYLGGSGVENVEIGGSIAVDASNSAYVVGTTSSSNFPTFAAMQVSNKGGGSDAFVVKLNAAGSGFAYSTYLGGASIDFGESLAVDTAGAAYIGGYTASPDFPIGNAGQPAIGGNYDAFVTKLNPSGGVISESGFLGGGGADAAYGIAVDSSGNAYLAGQTFSADFPLLGPVQTTLGSSLAAFAAKFTFGASGPPTAVSAGPSGTGAAQTFTLVYADSRGFTDINWVEMNWSATTSTANSCYLHYDRVTNTVQLSNDAGTGWLSSFTLGAPGTSQNAQCILDAGASSVSGSGANLTINLALAFKPVFAGVNNIYMRVQDAAGTLIGWQSRGTWTVVAAPPANISVAPSNGSGITQAFNFVFSDPYGSSDIRSVNILFGGTLAPPSSCFVQYTVAGNLLQLVADSGSGYAGQALMGFPSTISNGQCAIAAGSSSVIQSGNNFTINLLLTFTGTFAGTKTVFMGAVNSANVFAGWEAKGTWIVPTGGLLTASNVSVAPNNGTGANQTFRFVYSDPYGFTDISSVNILINNQIGAASACFVQYTRATNTVSLVQDSGSGFTGSAIVGAAATLNNSQCTVDAAGSSVSGSGNLLTLNLAIVFKPAFSGNKNLYMGVYNSIFVFTGWDARGTWNVLGSLPPLNVSVNPPTGSGAVQTFTFVFSDPYGATDISFVDILIHSQINATGACFIQYTRSTNALVLVQDSGIGYVGANALGFPGTLSNSQCALDAWASSVTVAGNNFTLSLALSFKTAFSGAKNVYMGVVNNADVFSGWDAKGTWNITSATTPSSISVSPAFGNTASTILSIVFSDAADINFVNILINNQIAASNACFVQFTKLTNTLALVQNSGSGYAGSIPAGALGTLTNSQCSVNATESNVSISGNEMRINLSLTFNHSFAGLKTVYLGVVNNLGIFAGWQGKGTWTVP